MPTDNSSENEMMQLRAHHICCVRFWDASFGDRGAGFLRVRDKIKRVLDSSPKTQITVIEGADELCQQCPLCVEGRCSSPLGDKEEVRKWDALLLRELGLSYGTTLTSAEWQKLIEQKVPFRLCQKCQWKQVCRVGARLL